MIFFWFYSAQSVRLQFSRRHVVGVSSDTFPFCNSTAGRQQNRTLSRSLYETPVIPLAIIVTCYGTCTQQGKQKESTRTIVYIQARDQACKTVE